MSHLSICEEISQKTGIIHSQRICWNTNLLTYANSMAKCPQATCLSCFSRSTTLQSSKTLTEQLPRKLLITITGRTSCLSYAMHTLQPTPQQPTPSKNTLTIYLVYPVFFKPKSTGKTSNILTSNYKKNSLPVLGLYGANTLTTVSAESATAYCTAQLADSHALTALQRHSGLYLPQMATQPSLYGTSVSSKNPKAKRKGWWQRPSYTVKSAKGLALGDQICNNWNLGVCPYTDSECDRIHNICNKDGCNGTHQGGQEHKWTKRALLSTRPRDRHSDQGILSFCWIVTKGCAFTICASSIFGPSSSLRYQPQAGSVCYNLPYQQEKFPFSAHQPPKPTLCRINSTWPIQRILATFLTGFKQNNKYG